MDIESVLPVLCELFVKSVLISLSAALLVKAWRGANSAQRHLIWLAALAAVMMLPVTRLVSPRWAIPVQPAKKVTLVIHALPPASEMKFDTAPPSATIAAPAATSTTTSTLLDWRKVLLGVWLSGAAFLLVHRLFGSWRLLRLRQRSAPVDDPRIRLLLSRTLSELNVRSRPEIRLSEECRVPVTWGTLRPVMLLPTQALEWNDAWLLAALRHEAAHILRHDYLTRWIAHVACAIYWPNPFIWLAARSLRIAQEHAADDLVLRAGTPADEYATQLVAAARTVATHGFLVGPAVAMACPSTLEDRVRAIVDGRRDRRPLGRWALSIGSMIVLLTLAICTAAQLQGADPAAPAEEPAPGAKAPKSKEPQIELSAKFIEISDRPSEAPQATTPPLDFKTNAVFTDPQFQIIIRSLNQKKGVDLVAAPSMTTRSKQAVTIEVVREFRYPTDWDKDKKEWKPKAFTTKNVGVKLEATPEIRADGSIELHLKPGSSEFDGFIDLDDPKHARATDLKGKRLKPVFQESELETTVQMQPDQTVVIPGLKPRLDSQIVNGKKEYIRARLLVFVSARLITPASPAAPSAENADVPATKQWSTPPHFIPEKRPAKDWLAAKGVVFKDDTWATYIPATNLLLVHNTLAQLEVVDGLVPPTPTPVGAVAAMVKLQFDGGRVELVGQSVTTEKDGGNLAQVDARLRWGESTMWAQSIRYHQVTQQVDLERKVEIRNGTERIEADKLTVGLEPGGHLKIAGLHKTSVIDEKPASLRP